MSNRSFLDPFRNRFHGHVIITVVGAKVPRQLYVGIYSSLRCQMDFLSAREKTISVSYSHQCLEEIQTINQTSDDAGCYSCQDRFTDQLANFVS